MLYELLIQGEDTRWETFKKAEQEAQRREAVREDRDGTRIRKLARNALQRRAHFAAVHTDPSRP